MAIRVEVLGPVRMIGEGGTLELRGQIGRTVAAFLAAELDAVVSVDQLVAAVWDDEPPGQPVATIRSTISRLRSVLPGGALVSHGGGSGYSLAAALVDVDLRDFERALGGHDPTELAAALRLWRGRPFDDVAETPAFSPYRERAREIRAALTHRHRSLLIGLGELEQASALLADDLADNPLFEPMRLLQVRALIELGQLDAARTAVAAHRELLVERTGLEPSPAFLEIERTVAGPTRAPLPEPQPTIELIGRDGELRRLLTEAAAPGLISVTGLGGVGKTRLMLEAQRLLDRTMATVDLASVDPAADVRAAIGAALGLQSTGDESLELLMQRLEATQALLVLDNCEHVADSVRQLATEVSTRFPGLTIVATTRAPLGLAGERVVRLEPFGVPSDADHDTAAVRLFAARAAQAGAPLADDAETLAAVRDICSALGGLPLAIELAAARVASVGLDELHRRLPGDMSILQRAVYPGGAHRESIDDVIAWSLGALPPESADLLRQLAVFPSGFTLAGVEAVSGNARAAVALAELIANSLVAPDVVAGGGGHRLRLLEPIRAAVRQEFGEAEWASLRGAHARWVLGLGSEIERLWRADSASAAVRTVQNHRADFDAAVRTLAGSGQAAAVELLAVQLAPVLTEHRDLALLDVLAQLCGTTTAAGEAARAHLVLARRPLTESADFAQIAVEHAERAVASAESDPNRFAAAIPWAYGLLVLGRLDDVVAGVDATLATGCVGPRESAQLAAIQALALVTLGRPADAEQALTRHAAWADRYSSGGLVELARSYIAGEQVEQALAHCQAAIDAAESDRAPVLRLIHEEQMLWLLASGGRLAEAARLARALVPRQLEAGLRQVVWVTLRVVAWLFRLADRPADAAVAVAAIVAGAGLTPLDRHSQLERDIADWVAERIGPAELERIGRGATTNLPALWAELDMALSRF